jgi:hypothetical protein
LQPFVSAVADTFGPKLAINLTAVYPTNSQLSGTADVGSLQVLRDECQQDYSTPSLFQCVEASPVATLCFNRPLPVDGLQAV